MREIKKNYDECVLLDYQKSDGRQCHLEIGMTRKSVLNLMTIIHKEK